MKLKTAYRLEIAVIIVLAILFLPVSLPAFLLGKIVDALKWVVSWRDCFSFYFGHKLFVATKEYKEEVKNPKMKRMYTARICYLLHYKNNSNNELDRSKRQNPEEGETEV